MVGRIQSLEEAIEEDKKAQAEKKRKARELAGVSTEAPPAEAVTVRVLKKGDGVISTGQHVGGYGDAYYERGETFLCDPAVANELEDRDLVEIVPEVATKAAKA